MALVIWAPQAVEDLDAVCAFIARDSDVYARDFAARVVGAVELLREFPQAGRVVPEFADPSLRELLHGHYRIIYEVTAEAVHVLAVHHGARLLRARPQ
jgi:plasmid stabilization system protein ParE